MEIPEGQRKFWISATGIAGIVVIAATGLIMKSADFPTVYNGALMGITGIVGAFTAGNLIEHKMKKNAAPAPPTP